MKSNRVIINDYPRSYGYTTNNGDRSVIIQDIIEKTINQINDNFKIEVYNWSEEFNTHKLGKVNESLVIMNYYTDRSVSNKGISETKYGKALPAVGDGLLIKDEEGCVIAEYRELIANNGDNMSQLNILIDALKEPDNFDVFTYIIMQLNELVVKKFGQINSWKNTSSKQLIIDRLQRKFNTDKSETIRRLERNIRDKQARIEEYRGSLTEVFRGLQQSMRDLEKERSSDENVSDVVIKDLDILSKEEKIKDITITNNGEFEIYTNVLTIYDENNNKYYGGEFKILLDMINSSVKFFNNEGWHGFWTDKDPHPHVNGNGGYPCLGNLDATVAELSSQYQLYPLVLMCIEYLESVNTADSAGAHIRYWDKLDEEDNRIPADKNAGRVECEHCGEYVEEDDLRTAYNEIIIDEDGDYELYGEHLVCDDCLVGNYEYSHTAEEWGYEIIINENEEDEGEDC